MQTLDYRFETRASVLEYIADSKKFFKQLGSGDCFADSRYKNLKVMQKLGAGDNIQGDAYKACTVDKNTCNIDVALKLILPTVGDIETQAMALTNVLLEARLCPNLPLMYSFSKCNDCTFDKGVMWIDKNGGTPLPGEWKLRSSEKKRYTKYDGKKEVQCTTILNEFAQYGDFSNWFKKNKRTEMEMMNAIFQVFCGIYSIWRNYGATHNDLHVGNVLMHKTSNKDGVWEYIIDGTPYYCPNIGFLAVLWDLGFFVAPGMVAVQRDYVQSNGFMYGDDNIQGVDARKFVMSIKYCFGKTWIVSMIYDWLMTNETLDIGHAIKKFFSIYTKQPKKPIIETYFMDKYTPHTYFENLDTETITRLAAKFRPSDWAAIVTNRGLSVAEIRMFKKYIDKQLLSRVVRDHAVVDAFADSLDWKLLSRWKNIGEQRIEQHRDEVDWSAVSQFVKLSPEFVAQNAQFLVWDAVSKFQTHLPASLWIEFRDRVRWEYMTDERIANWCTAQIEAVAAYMPWSTLAMSTRTDKSVATLAPWVDWGAVSRYRPMSVEFIKDHADKLDWRAVTVNPNIDIDTVASMYPSRVAWDLITEPSLNLMRKFPRNLDWSAVSRTIKQKYIAEFERYIDWTSLQTYNKLSDTTLTRYLSKLDFGIISRTQILSKKFIEKHADDLDWNLLRIANLPDKALVRNADSINWSLPENAHAFASLSSDSAIDVARRTKINWRIVSQHVSDSSIDFLETFHNKLDWDIISRTAVLSPDVVNNFPKTIDAAVYTRFDKFEMTDYTRLGGWVSWENVSAHARLSAYEIRMFAHVLDLGKVQYTDFDWEFFRTHQDEIDWTSVRKLNLPELFRREFYNKLN